VLVGGVLAWLALISVRPAFEDLDSRDRAAVPGRLVGTCAVSLVAIVGVN
jgi:hypothetical protein